MKKHALLLLFIMICGQFNSSAKAASPLDPNLEPNAADEKSNVFQDMGVVQNKSMKKRGKFLLSTYIALDFSDGPYTNYSIHLNPGYAFSDFFEMYVSYAPAYIVSPRSIVARINSLPAPTGGHYSIVAARPNSEYGLEALWLPFYGKDSFGISQIIRSDTFFKFGATQINYDSTTGMSYKLGAGKTFFVGSQIGFRFAIDYDYLQTVVDNIKSFNGVLLTELGLTFYF